MAMLQKPTPVPHFTYDVKLMNGNHNKIFLLTCSCRNSGENYHNVQESPGRNRNIIWSFL